MSQKRIGFASFGLLVLLSIATLRCGKDKEAAPQPSPKDTPKQATPPEPANTDPRFELTSPNITHRSAIPAVNTCDGEGTSPQLDWTDPPEGTQALVIIVTDPDVPGNFTHWIVYNLPPSLRSLPAGVPGDGVLANYGGARQGRNGFGKDGWGGPCPPAGSAHRYVFRLYALDAMLDLPPDADRLKLEDAMKGHYRAQAALIASYARAEGK